MYGAEVIALALNTEDCSKEEALAFQQQYASVLKIPVLLPLQQGVDKMIPVLQSLMP